MRDETSEPEPTPLSQPRTPWWRRIDWTKTATVVGVAAGIGSLLFTGVATYYGAVVSQAQLEQSREDSERQVRGQAMRVTYWIDKDSEGVHQLHVVNRSLDPVNHVNVDLMVRLPPIEEGPHKWAKYQMQAVDLAPCSELLVPWDSLSYQEERNGEWKKQPDVDVARVTFIFDDRDGRPWVRTDDYDQRLVSLGSFERRDNRHPEWIIKAGRMERGPLVKPVSDCAYDSSSASGRP
ncbi:hypothetical protein [Streptomyces anthocyanicus]|uniref:hypothetical protein n=1 Tax=Streptomyces anthocyanicus TaxID=68174 RepID=UPI00386C3806